MSDETARSELRKFVAWSMEAEALERRTFAGDLAASLRAMHGPETRPTSGADVDGRSREVADALIDRVLRLSGEMGFGRIVRPDVETVVSALRVFARPRRAGRPARDAPSGSRASALVDVWLAFGLVSGPQPRWLDAARKTLERER